MKAGSVGSHLLLLPSYLIEVSQPLRTTSHTTSLGASVRVTWPLKSRWKVRGMCCTGMGLAPLSAAPECSA